MKRSFAVQFYILFCFDGYACLTVSRVVSYGLLCKMLGVVRAELASVVF